MDPAAAAAAPSTVAVVLTGLDVAFRTGVLILLLLRGPISQPVRLAWILVVIAVPVLGGLLYLRLGSPSPGRLAQRRARSRERVAPLADAAPRPAGDRVEVQHPELAKGARLVAALGGLAPCGGNRLRLFGTGEPNDDTGRALRLLIDDIDGARTSCHLLSYIFLDDEVGGRVADALERAAARGVHSRLLLDAIGSRPFLRSRRCRRLREAGVEVRASLPLRPFGVLLRRLDNRNHRKLTVIDGTVGWTGSQNIASPAFTVKARFAPWIDLMVRVEGPVVHDLQRVFVEDWLLEANDPPDRLMTPRPLPFADGTVVQLLPSGPGLDGGSLRELVLLGFLESDHELVLTTPYFVPDEATLSALLAVARSGVPTRIVLPQRNDSRLVAAASRAYYDQLLSAGVEIFEYPEGLLHAKTFSFDHQLSVVATTNVDRRSFELNFELNLVVVDPEFNRSLRAVQQGYIERSVPIRPEEWRRRPALHRLAQNAAQLLAPLL